MTKQHFIYSCSLKQLFYALESDNFKSTLIELFGGNLPSNITNNKNKVLCDKSVSNYRSETFNDVFGQIAHYCVSNYGNSNFIYSWEKILDSISKLSFVKTYSGTPWASDGYDQFYGINRKRLKKWFKQNHNRFLYKKSTLLIAQLDRSISF